MIATILSATPIGYNCSAVQVEGDIKNGLPNMQIIGMGTKSIEEAKERVRSALTNSGFAFPPCSAHPIHGPRTRAPGQSAGA